MLKSKIFILFWVGILFLGAFSCSDSKKKFTLLSPRKTGIKFKNILKETKDFNVLTYGYLYNGGGIAIGDVNNDGLEDIYFTGNMVASRLYINQGNLNFKEVAEEAGVDAPGLWNTGTTMVDINGDGWLDIFVCRSAAANPILRKNLFFINNGDMTFTESAGLLGINDTGYTTQVLFFDYDRDNDLDLYVLNHSVQKYAGFSKVLSTLKNKSNKNYGDRLYENVGGIFLDKTEKAKIKTNVLGFGLGIASSDFNNDNWPDLYISNDYNEQDYLYINNQDGTFSDKLDEYITHTSMFSMGSDVADINNDGFTDILTLDMLPEGNARQKMVFGPDNYDKYQRLVKSGFYNQTMRNMLHLNQEGAFFTEIGQLSGVSNTDWSWSSLFADFDNDGFKDLFITNGYKRDYTNMDFINYAVQQKINETQNKKEIAVVDLIEKMPPIQEINYMFKNLDGIHFKKMNESWGLDQKTISNGAVYSDLDNDGDLDIIVNNIDNPASIYRNNSNFDSGNSVQITLKDPQSQNKEAIGARVTLYSDSLLVQQVNQPVRGYQSSVSRRLFYGIGNREKIDSIEIIWPDGQKQISYDPVFSPFLSITKKITSEKNISLKIPGSLFNFTKLKASQKIVHKENEYVDFKEQRLLPYFLSTQGPRIAIGDSNGDGIEDIYLGGSMGTAGSLWIQNASGSFTKSAQKLFEQDKIKEDVDALFFDCDNDGDQDLYVVSGGTENESEENYQDRLYINVNGKFNLSDGLPRYFKSGSCVTASDIDNDGDLDLFVGTRQTPGRYPEVSPSQLLINNGSGGFRIANERIPNNNNLGNVTDALWEDINGDNQKDLVVVGEWMPITVLFQKNGTFIDSQNETLKNTTGLWNRIVRGDFNQDGRIDFALGNYGMNSQLKPPLSLYYDDFDNNGSIDPILCVLESGKEYPFLSKDDIQSQLVSLKSKYVSYSSFADQTIQDVFDQKTLQKANKLNAKLLKSSVLLNISNNTFEIKPLPDLAQISPVFGIIASDFDQDGNLDIITGGNLFGTRVKLGRLDASKGEFFKGNGNGLFQSIPYSKSGLKSEGEIRDIVVINIGGKPHLIFAKNNAPIEVYELK